MKHSSKSFQLLVCCAMLAAAGTPLQAQTIYRIVGPDGKVTFSDKPPADVTKATATSASGKAVATTDAQLPYELRQVATRYPVTLYAGVSCAPCNSGRLLLQSRGIPFTENTVSTQEDAEALKRISGDTGLPFLTIGGQKIKGFSEAEWSQFLTAANYPANSLLPSSYRNPPPKPLVVVQRPAAPQAPQRPAENEEPGEERSAARPPATPAADSGSNPVGIKF